jgi:hypothetical protein
VSQAPDRQKFDELLKLLVEQKIISAPQVDIARADAEVTGMPLDEVLIARRWVTEEKLYTLAPWLRQPLGTTASQTPSPDNNSASATPAVRTDLQEKPTKAEAAVQPPEDGKTSSTDFDENLRKYRELMSEILGEAN